MLTWLKTKEFEAFKGLTLAADSLTLLKKNNSPGTSGDCASLSKVIETASLANDSSISGKLTASIHWYSNSATLLP